ncbi:hypothetical protein KL1_00013 [Burkholderia phage vB_BceS_KL1]|uniref:Virion structural protein n=1 Tax=Burkholderia phage vB_BceS_KL1 TaxID=1132026 RepID=I6NMA3_9CAUD|nr:virion structural protein [Burkholderia phage vB_BceS_KL1]AEX56097.1 hypothetical protein KL1_00013 [Burkholderia phage vB_BceS_KL1]
MATKKVIYFTAGINATSGELADIAKLNAAAEPQYEVIVANGAANAKYGETNRLIPSDFVAGTIPGIYGEIDEIDPDNIPNQALTDTQTIVNDGDTLEVTTGGDPAGTVTFAVVDGVLTGTFVAAE